jgi:hypothetical protein
MLLASSTLPLGIWKNLSNSHPVAMKAFLSPSFLVLTLEVALLSMMAKGMDTLRTPSLKSLMLLTCSLWSLPYLLIWQVGGALLSSIE